MTLPFAKLFGLTIFLLASLALLRSSALAEPAVPPDLPSVSTLAGSGAVGVADGPAQSATFVAPAGIAYDASGTLYVADREGQRIRAVSRSGVVRTLAGSSPMVPLGIGGPGGFADGPAAKALFDMPSAVLPLPDGSVVVADTSNRCLRLVRSGVVSTYAGTRAAGGADGPKGAATFARPMALVRDSSGNIYVADPPNGVRKIDGRGIVTTLHFAESQGAVALAWTSASPASLLVATVDYIERVDLRTLALDRFFPLDFSFIALPTREGQILFREGLTNAGPASALAAFSSTDFLFTDALNSTVRLAQTEHAGKVELNYTRPLTATPPENASLGVAGFADGPGATALVDEPLGIAIAPDGSVAVADTGNRRIRLFSAFNRRTHLSTDEDKSELPARPDPHEYRIAIVGNSYLWWNQAWHESIAGMTEDLLLQGAHGPRQPRVLPIMRLGLDSLAALNIIDNELSDGVADMVILDLATFGQMGGDGYAGYAYPQGWQSSLTAALSQTTKTLQAAHIPFLVINQPGAPDFPTEYAYFRIPKGTPDQHGETGAQNEPTDIQYYHDQIAAVLASTQAPTLDLWPAFLDAYESKERVPLFNVWDHHLSAFGRKIVATKLAQQILDLKPWAQTSPPAR